MTTRHSNEALSAYLAGRLSGAERAAVEEHLKTCAACYAELDRLKEVDHLLAQDGQIEPSRNFTQRVLEQVNRENRVVSFRARRVAAWVAAAAVIVFAVFLLRILKDGGPPPPAPLVKKTPAQQEPVVKQPAPAPAESSLTPEDADLIAHLDELEDMELIDNFDSLQELDTALLASEAEHVR
jgi:anti-sigma factor RsiW